MMSIADGNRIENMFFLVISGQALVESSPLGNLGAPMSSSPPPSSVSSVISIPDDSPVTPQTFVSTMVSSYAEKNNAQGILVISCHTLG